MNGTAKPGGASIRRLAEATAKSLSSTKYHEPKMPGGQALLEAASAYARRGWAVLPLQPRGKTPLTAHGCLDATTDPAVIRGWWDRWTEANVGIACGPSGLVVVDLDADRGGLETWRELREHYGFDGATVTSLTGGGGVHLIYVAPSGVDVRNSAGKLGAGVDVRGNGGYIVAPPSVHPNETPYVWEISGDPKNQDPSPFPPELFELLLSDDRDKPNATLPAEREIPKGRRNVWLTSLAGSLRRQGLDKSTMLAMLRKANEARCVPPLADEEVETITKSVSRYPPGRSPRRLGDRLPKAIAELAEMGASQPLDPVLRECIVDTLLGEGTKAKPPVMLRRHAAGELLLSWLYEHGRFVRSNTDDRLCYFYAPERELLNLDTNDWRAWLYSLTGANPAGLDFAHLTTDCETAAQFAEKRDVLRLAAWDRETQTLRVSRLDGTVYVLDGEAMREEDNGEHVLFDDASWWDPYTPNPDRTNGMALRWATEDVPRWEGNTKLHALGYRAWMLTTFLTELCPTRPLLVLLGERGSGKTMTLRILLQLLFGPGAQVSGVPDKPDGFTAAASANHVLVLDNLDQFTGWLRDKLARLSTGAIDQYRRLYTSNELGIVRYRTWLAFTARTPDTLRRDDLADRLLLLPTTLIPDNERQPERHFLDQVRSLRDDWWGDVLNTLNGVVASIRRGKLATNSSLRMADWESLGRLVAQNEGQEELWDSFVLNLKRQQGGFLLTDELIVEALDAWMKDRTNHGRDVKSRELYSELTGILFDDKRPPKDWPKSTSAFGKRLAGIRHSLRTLYGVEWWQQRNYWIYQFRPLEGH